MRSFSRAVLGLLGCAHGFAPLATVRQPTQLYNTHISKDYTAGSGMTEHEIPLFIKNLSKDNFDESLEMLEALLNNECVGDICEDYVGQLQEKAKEIGKEIPKGFGSLHH